MTSEQIAEFSLDVGAALASPTDHGVRTVMAGLRRLLDEREALLEVLRKVTTADASMGDIRAAITKAESP